MLTIIFIAGLLCMFAITGSVLRLTNTLRRKVAAAEAVSTNMKCPYCHVEFSGVSELDLINHTLCVNRAADEIDKVRAEAEAKKVPEYFIDGRMSSWSSYGFIPDKYKQAAVYDTDGGYKLHYAKVYRDGECITTEYAKTAAAAKLFAERAIIIDKQKKKA